MRGEVRGKMRGGEGRRIAIWRGGEGERREDCGMVTLSMPIHVLSFVIGLN